MKKNKTMKELFRSYILSPEYRDYAFQNLDEKMLRKAIAISFHRTEKIVYNFVWTKDNFQRNK